MPIGVMAIGTMPAQRPQGWEPYPAPQTEIVVKIHCAGCGQLLEEGESVPRDEDWWFGDVPICPVCDAGVILERQQWHLRHPDQPAMA
jgi:hypothetical protein